MLFRDVIGQQEVKLHLLKMAQTGKIPHAQLFLSHPGSGALPLALAFSQYIVCEDKQQDDSCGKCPACIKAQKLIHPDIHFTYPVIAKRPSPHPSLSTDYIQEWRKAVTENPYLDELEWLQFIDAENKQGNISADEARNIIRGLTLMAFEATYKIHIIWMAEALTKIGNMLLKLLEEPPDNTVLILIVENQEELLPTILSRCQLLKINRIDYQSIAEGLLKRGIPGSSTEHLAYLSDGNFNEALKLAQSADSIETHQLMQFLKYTIRIQDGTNSGMLLKLIEELSKIGREKLKSFLEYLLYVLREAVQLKFAPGKTSRLTDEEFKIAKSLDKYINLDNLNELTELVNKKHYEIERNVNPKLVFMDMSMKLNGIIYAKKKTNV